MSHKYRLKSAGTSNNNDDIAGGGKHNNNYTKICHKISDLTQVSTKLTLIGPGLSAGPSVESEECTSESTFLYSNYTPQITSWEYSWNNPDNKFRLYYGLNHS